MTTLCRVVLTVVSCTLDPETPKPTPAEAVAILRAGGTRFFIPDPPQPAWPGYDPAISYYDRDWPFAGALAPAWAPVGRRLDGTSLLDAPVVYGVPLWLPRHGYRERIPHVRGSGRNGLSRDREGHRAERAPEAARPPVAAPRAPDRAPTRAGVGGAPVARRPWVR